MYFFLPTVPVSHHEVLLSMSTFLSRPDTGVMVFHFPSFLSFSFGCCPELKYVFSGIFFCFFFLKLLPLVVACYHAADLHASLTKRAWLCLISSILHLWQLRRHKLAYPVLSGVLGALAPTVPLLITPTGGFCLLVSFELLYRKKSLSFDLSLSLNSVINETKNPESGHRFPQYHMVTAMGIPLISSSTITSRTQLLTGKQKRHSSVPASVVSVHRAYTRTGGDIFSTVCTNFGLPIYHRNEDMPLKTHGEKNVPQKAHFFQTSSLYACSN